MVTNNRNAKLSAMYIGYLILNGIKLTKNEKVSIYDISSILKKNGISSSRQLILGLSFLFSVDILDFEEANVWIRK